MAPVTFQCGHCNQLMGVSAEYLGREVQCPHCKQVVVAPATAAPPEVAPQPEVVAPQEVAPTLNITTDHESIFTAPTLDEDIFDDAPPPRQEIAMELTASVPAEPALDVTTHYVPAEVSSEAVTTENIAAPVVEPPPEEPEPAVPMPWLNDAAPADPTSTLPPSARKAARGSGALSTVLMVPLISYAVLSTALLIFLYTQNKKLADEVDNAGKQQLQWLEELPDIHGDRPGAKEGDEPGARVRFPAVNKVELPPHLVVKLNDTLTVGDVAVTPTRVERKVVSIYTDGFEKPEPVRDKNTLEECPSLVLHLRVKNLSSQYAFAPLDAYFDRRHDEGVREPWTFLEPVGSGVRFFGGPAVWRPEKVSKDERVRREWIAGRPRILPYLEPGQEWETFICTDGSKDLNDTIDRHKGLYRWRIHLRRGPVEVPGRSAPVPASAVVAVEFSGDELDTSDAAALPQEP